MSLKDVSGREYRRSQFVAYPVNDWGPHLNFGVIADIERGTSYPHLKVFGAWRAGERKNLGRTIAIYNYRGALILTGEQVPAEIRETLEEMWIEYLMKRLEKKAEQTSAGSGTASG